MGAFIANCFPNAQHGINNHEHRVHHEARDSLARATESRAAQEKADMHNVKGDHEVGESSR